MTRPAKLKVFTSPVGLHSRAMVRVEKAIRAHAPSHVVFVDRPEDADLQFLHVIGWDGAFKNWPRPYVAIQYCLKTAGGDMEDWVRFWDKSTLTWSYYDLSYIETTISGVYWAPDRSNLFHAPLGADEIFREEAMLRLRRGPLDFSVHGSSRDLIVTTGYVSGPGAEAIAEVWTAAERTGWAGVHIGPVKVEGAGRALPESWISVEGCSDAALVNYYKCAAFVSGLRYGEGFELPAIEGALCGASPILFEQPSQHMWMGDYRLVRWMPETFDSARDGKGRYRPRNLTVALEELFFEAKHCETSEATSSGLAQILTRFNWANIVPDMWKAAGV